MKLKVQKVKPTQTKEIHPIKPPITSFSPPAKSDKSNIRHSECLQERFLKEISHKTNCPAKKGETQAKKGGTHNKKGENRGIKGETRGGKGETQSP